MTSFRRGIYFGALLLVVALTSCEDKKTSVTEDAQVTGDSLTSEDGKNWLKENIETYFNNDAVFLNGFTSLCTQQYAEFKTDATNVDLDGGMTAEEFKSKWGRRYSEYAGIGEGFMVAGSDFGEIAVTKCEFKNRTEMNDYIYEVIIEDKTFGSRFIRQVVLTKNGDSFLIDDVREISNEFQDQ